MDAGFLNIALDAAVKAHLHTNELKNSSSFYLLIKLALFFVEFVMVELKGNTF
jgi:hypothetical protein